MASYESLSDAELRNKLQELEEEKRNILDIISQRKQKKGQAIYSQTSEIHYIQFIEFAEH